MSYICPVCGYKNLPEPPVDMSYEICPSCGTEFGYTDFQRSHEALMLGWVHTGPRWFADWLNPPEDWNPRKQLLEYWVPSSRTMSGNVSVQSQRMTLVSGAVPFVVMSKGTAA